MFGVGDIFQHEFALHFVFEATAEYGRIVCP